MKKKTRIGPVEEFNGVLEIDGPMLCSRDVGEREMKPEVARVGGSPAFKEENVENLASS